VSRLDTIRGFEMSAAQGESWRLGQRLVDLPLNTVGITSDHLCIAAD